MDQLAPHYVKIAYREGDFPYCDRSLGADMIPHKFADWFAANQFANSRRSDVCTIFPYYPEYADLERRYIQSMIDREEANFKRLIDAHDQRITELQAALEDVPA